MRVCGFQARRSTAETLLLALAVALFALLPAGGDAVAASGPPTMLGIECPSPALGGTLPAAVFLPPGYAGGQDHYPVIYFLHGLPAGPTTYTGTGFVAQALIATGRSAIVVTPQGARTNNSDREYLNWGTKENWPAAISHDLTRCTDARFRTIPSRRGRALIGVSAGGFGAFNIGLRQLATFGAVESWSGYFEATDPSGLHQLNLGSPQANAAARVPRGQPLKQALARWSTFIGFFVGRQDARFFSDNVQLDKVFSQYSISHSFSVYQGAHSGAVWIKYAPAWLASALAHLSAPQPPTPGGSASGGAPIQAAP